jgi:hypothetical protein
MKIEKDGGDSGWPVIGGFPERREISLLQCMGWVGESEVETIVVGTRKSALGDSARMREVR